MLCFSNTSTSLDDDFFLFDGNLLFNEVEDMSILKTEDLAKLTTEKIPINNYQLDAESIKNKVGHNKPTKQWIHRCNGDKDTCLSLIDVEQISKL